MQSKSQIIHLALARIPQRLETLSLTSVSSDSIHLSMYWEKPHAHGNTAEDRRSLKMLKKYQKPSLACYNMENIIYMDFWLLAC